ncbi:MAG: DNA replication/repair protein RecF [Spirochaetes bacterium]|nr:DNA replication/repair protein RecF [Spirochaetota bacterium]
MVADFLLIKNFRNYENEKFIFSPNINFLIGNNGAGKTNVIEALTVLSGIKSFRGVSDKDLVRWNCDSYYCCVECSGKINSRFEIGYQLYPDKSVKKIKKNGNEIVKFSDYYGDIITVIFSPDDINIINGVPEVRRKYFDGLISKTDKIYLRNLTDFKKIIASRNKCLRDIAEKSAKKDQLEIWNDFFAEKSEYIISKRAEFINDFNIIFKNEYEKISSEKIIEIPEISYAGNITPDKNDILKKLNENYYLEIKRKTTLIGPQKDDYVLKCGDTNFLSIASQGQKRTSVISLKNAEIKFIEKIRDENVIILIDDIFSELDNIRKKNLIESISLKNQVIITAVNLDSIMDYFTGKNIKIFNIDNAVVTEK